MTRRPVDQVVASRDPATRQDLWVKICAVGDQGASFSVHQVFRETYMPRQTIENYLLCLVAGGFATRDTSVSPIRYALIGKPPAEAPRLRRDGTKVTQGSGAENMWRTMRIMAEFSPRDIAAHATTDMIQVSEATAKHYCSFLYRTGYLRLVRAARPRRGQAVYRLIRNSGPQAPMIQRVQRVFDPNTNEVFDPSVAS